MDLKTYLSAKRGRQAQLAKAVGVFAPDVSRWADGSRPIPEKYGWPIELATGGAVTRRELFPKTCANIWPDLAEGRAAVAAFRDLITANHKEN